MSQQLLQHIYEMFPLEYHLEKQGINLDKMVTPKSSVKLLSQVRGLDREVVEYLEKTGIFDTDDFQEAKGHLKDHLGIGNDQLESMSKLIELELRGNSNQPRILLKLPDNYALVAAFSDQNGKVLAILWKGLYIQLDSSRVQYWFGIKDELDRLMVRMNQPQLVGRIMLDDTPQWLAEVTPLSTYISDLSPLRSLDQIAGKLGLEMDSTWHQVKREIMSASYLVELSRKFA